MDKYIKELQKYIDSANSDIEIIETRDGHLKLVGGAYIVDWWPESKRMTAYVEGTPKGVKYATAKMVFNLARGAQ